MDRKVDPVYPLRDIPEKHLKKHGKVSAVAGAPIWNGPDVNVVQYGDNP